MPNKNRDRHHDAETFAVADDLWKTKDELPKKAPADEKSMKLEQPARKTNLEKTREERRREQEDDLGKFKFDDR
jgi:hypothetical protein